MKTKEYKGQGRGSNPNSANALRKLATKREKTKERVSVFLDFALLDYLEVLSLNRSLAINEALLMIQEMGLTDQLKSRLADK